MYGQKIRKRKDYTIHIGTMTADDSRSQERYVTNEYRHVKLYPQHYGGGKKGFSKGTRSGNCLGGPTDRTSTAFNRTIKQGATTDRSSDGYRIPAKVCGTQCYLTIEKRNAVYEMDLSEDPTLPPARTCSCSNALSDAGTTTLRR